jgi:hypothetical protein
MALFCPAGAGENNLNHHLPRESLRNRQLHADPALLPVIRLFGAGFYLPDEGNRAFETRYSALSFTQGPVLSHLCNGRRQNTKRILTRSQVVCKTLKKAIPALPRKRVNASPGAFTTA